MSLKTQLENVSRYTLALAGLAAIALVFTALLVGFAVAVKFLFPLFSVLAALSCGVFLVVILPLSLLHRLRPRLAIITFLLSVVCGVSLWMYSFLVIIGYWGWFSLFFFLVFRAVAPLAAFTLLLKERWLAGGSLLFGLAITYGMRMYSLWLEGLYLKKEREGETEIIDVEAERVDE